MNYTVECAFVTDFRGVSANDYATHLEYVKSGAWEKDYFVWWIDTHGLYKEDYPTLKEIEDFCHQVSYYLRHWFDGVKAGKIDPEAGTEN